MPGIVRSSPSLVTINYSHFIFHFYCVTVIVEQVISFSAFGNNYQNRDIVTPIGGGSKEDLSRGCTIRHSVSELFERKKDHR